MHRVRNIGNFKMNLKPMMFLNKGQKILPGLEYENNTFLCHTAVFLTMLQCLRKQNRLAAVIATLERV